MLHNVEFEIAQHRRVRPLAEAPWHDEPAIAGDETLAPHLRSLGAEWPCVPFARSTLDPVFHGFGADNDWSFAGERDGFLNFAIDYPSEHPIAGLRRTVRGVPGEPALELSLTVNARNACDIGIGLHPNFVIPQGAETFAVRLGYSHGETFPTVFEKDISTLAIGERFGNLDELPRADGSAISLSDLASGTAEEGFQLFGVDGVVSLEYPQRGFRARLEWSARDFPTCLFWVSAAGRQHRPWNGRFRGMGVEPLAATFGTDGCPKSGPGNFTRHFDSGESWTTRYRISAEAL
jgi:hypothetical protein